MSFSYSAGTITQTGTDTDLSGLSGLTGVTEETSGGYTLYNLGTGILSITGTLTIDPQTEGLATAASPANFNNASASVPVQVSGTLNIGSKTTSGSATRYAPGDAIRCTTDGTNLFNITSIYVTSAGTLNFISGNVFIGAIFSIEDGGTLNMEAGARLVNTNATIDLQLRLNTTTTTNDAKISVVGSVLDGVTNALRIFTKSSWSVMSPVLARANFQTFNQSQPDLEILNYDVTSNVNAADLLYNATNAADAATITVKNASGRMGYDTADSGIPKSGYFKTVRAVDLDFVDSAGSALGLVSVYGVDSDSGVRVVGPATGQDDTADKVYSADEATGTISFDMLSEVFIADEDTETTDDRTNANGFIPLTAIAYGYQAVSVRPDLFGLGTVSLEPTLVVNPTISASRATVAAYTVVSTAQEAYDALELYRVQNFTGQAEIAALSSNVLDFGDKTVVFDATAANVIDVTGTTVTIKSTTFAGTPKTTDAVTTANGATITGGIIDTNGDSFLSFTAEWEVYATEADRNASTNLLDSGAATETYRFDFSASTVYYMWVAGTKQQIEPLAAGETLVDLSNAALLVGIQSGLDSIPAVVFVNTLSATNGTGSAASPFNTLADGIARARASNASEVRVASSPASPAIATTSLAGLKIAGNGGVNTLSLGGQDCTGTNVEGVIVTGAMTGAQATLEKCGISALTDFNGQMDRCTFIGDASFSSGSIIRNCVSAAASDITLTLADASASIAIRDHSGPIVIAGLAGLASSIDGDAAQVELASSCTAGSFRASGDVELIDNSGAGCTVTDETTATRLRELHLMRGLDPDNAVTVTATQETGGDITLGITGDGTTTSTLTRSA